MAKEKSIGAVVFRQRREGPEFLLLHYPAGHWGFPKGHVEGNESDEETLLREIREETGLTGVEVIPGFKEHTKYFFKREKETVFKEVFFYLVKSSLSDPKISHEHQAFEWLPYKKALERLGFKNTKQVLEKANEFLHQASSKKRP